MRQPLGLTPARAAQQRDTSRLRSLEERIRLLFGRRAGRAIAGMLILLALAEVVVRASGAVDFPLYVVDDDFGYFPRPHQAGAFLRINRWVFNDRGMAVESDWTPQAPGNVLVIGNSIVIGGNPYDQPDKLAPLLRARLGSDCAPWPVAAGGWSQVNELRFLERNPDLVERSRFFVWEYMSGGLDAARPWTRETLHPTQPPIWAFGYVVRKRLEERFALSGTPAVAPAASSGALASEFEAMVERLARSGPPPHGIVLLYPTSEDLAQARSGREWLHERAWLEGLARRQALIVIDLAREPSWHAGLYRDGVHPTAAGNAILADILSASLRAALPECR